ncbi:MAG TPA: GAD-like domain-containing protein [Oculatellaceae cyanobacterium]
MIDQFYSLFIESFGLPTARESITDVVLSKYAGVLPESFIAFWNEFGWCTFKSGLLWTVNPDIFRGILGAWIDPIEELKHREYVVFARSAFGTLYAWSPITGDVLRVQCARGFIITRRKHFEKKKDKERSLQSFFASADPKDYDFIDEEGHGLFQQAIKGIGPLGSADVYGFEPLLALGGSPSIATVKKLRMDVHLEMLQQCSDPILSIV